MPQEMSDADVFGPDVHSLVTAAADRYNIPREILHNVAHTESGYNQSAISPKGAVGVMQLMPGTARDLGVDSTDAAQNVDGGARYLKAQHDRFGDWRLAAAAYNAGPDAVEKHGGVPPYPETQRYVDAVAPQTEMSDADVFGPSPQAAPQAAPGAHEIGASHNRGVTIDVGGAPTSGGPTIAQDVASGFTQPFVNLGHDVMQSYRDQTAHMAPPKSLGEFAQQTGADLMRPLHMAGDVLGLASAPVQALIRPTARAVNRVLPGATVGPQLSFVGGKPVLSAPRQLQGAEAQADTENMLGTALSGARPAAPGWRLGAGYGSAPAAARPMSLDQVQTASDAAWDAVDKSGYRFPKTDAQAMAGDVSKSFDEAGGADLYPRAAPLVKRIQSLAGSDDGLSVAQVNRLRSQIGAKLLQPGSDEADMGGLLKGKVEGLIQTANDPSLANARDLYTRLKKMQEVTDRAQSAALKVPQNGSLVQPTRTAMRPLIDPKSPQQIRNLTPDETAAIKKLSTGSVADGPLAVGRFFDPRSLIGNVTNNILGAMTHGAAPFVTGPIGVASTAISNSKTTAGIKNLLDLISAGGVSAKGSPVYPTLALAGRPGPAILSPAGLIGGSAIAGLPARTRALLESSKPSARASVQGR